MGLINRLIKSITGENDKPLEFVYADNISIDATIEGIGEPIEADTCYLELFLESVRISRARKFASKFQGIVYSFVTLAREGNENALLSAVSRPERLEQLDKNSITKAIQVGRQLMAPVAYRGGSIQLELGLFSVKSGNLLTPILNYVAEISAAAGISFVGSVKPFVPLIEKGMDLIASHSEDTELEVGLDTSLKLKKGAVVAIIAKDKKEIDNSKLSLDNDKKLLYDGQPLDAAYAVFSIRSTTMKPDYGEIPELKEKFNTFLAAIKSGKRKDTREAVLAFRLAVVASPDLITTDIKALIKKAEDRFNLAFPDGVEASVNQRYGPEITTLAEIGLYD
jgi:hypothetical protein